MMRRPHLLYLRLESKPTQLNTTQSGHIPQHGLTCRALGPGTRCRWPRIPRSMSCMSAASTITHADGCEARAVLPVHRHAWSRARYRTPSTTARRLALRASFSAGYPVARARARRWTTFTASSR
eukprot:2779866-Rhodomonas_salina.7